MKQIWIAAVLLPCTLHACSGPHVREAISGAEVFGREGALLVGCLLVLSTLTAATFTHNWRWPAAQLLLLAGHPSWTISPATGDCGQVLITATLAFAALAIVLIFIQLTAHLFAGRRIVKPAETARLPGSRPPGGPADR